MKTIQRNFRTMFALFILALLGISCSPKGVAPTTEIVGEKNAKEFQRLMTARESYKGETFDIVGVKQDGDILKIEVLGGCVPEEYKVVWNGMVAFSMPMQTGLVISLERKQDVQCLAILKHTITIDLKKLIGSNYSPENFIITVANGSKIDDRIIEPGGVVTVKK